MPGRHPWPACKQKAGGSHHRWAEQPAFPARWLDGLYALSPGTGYLAPVSRQRVTRVALGISTGMPGPHDFAGASDTFVRAR
jgi:hypothetical protein